MYSLANQICKQHMKQILFDIKTMYSKLKSVIIATLLISLSVTITAQQRSQFSEKAITIKDYTTKQVRTFLPFTKGDIKVKTSGIYKPVFDKICSIIASWEYLLPPQGIQVFCYGQDNRLEIYFSPYMFEDGCRFPSEGYSKLDIQINELHSIVGKPVLSGIYCCPQKTSDFYGCPVYNIGKGGGVTVATKKDIPLYIAVTQEEYMKTLIDKTIKETPPPPDKQDYQKKLLEMENNYQQLRKINAAAAKEVKQAINELRNEINQNKENPKSLFDPVSILKNKFLAMSEEEKRENAYYGGDDISGLIPYEQKEYGDLLVKINPALISEISKSGINLLTIEWEINEVPISEKSELYNEGRLGFLLTDYLMSLLHEDQDIWNRILDICNKD